MITSAAVRAFLARPRRDCREYKRLSDDELDERRRRLPVRPPIWSKLRRHQRAVFLAVAELGRLLCLMDTGCGKTLVSIAAARYLVSARVLQRKTLVVVPNKTNKAEWRDEVRKHSPSSSILVLRGSSADKWKQLAEWDGLFVVETYMGLVRMVSELVPVKPRRGRKSSRKNALRPAPRLVRRLVREFDGLVMDECTHVAAKGKLPNRVCRQVALKSALRIGLTGTPFGRDPSALWGQFYLIDDGHTLGETLGLFRAAFFKSSVNYWGGTEYTFDDRKKSQLNRFLAHCSIRYKAAAADLPRVTRVTRYVNLSRDAKTLYARARASLVAARGNYREMKNEFTRMRQISSGWVGFYDDDEGKKAQSVFTSNPKLDALLALVESIPRDRKIVIFHDFVYSGAMIGRALDEMKIGHGRIWSRAKDETEVLRRFKEDADCQVLVMNQAGGYGLNLQVAQYGLFYETPVPVIMHKQMRARFVRQYSTHDRVFVYYFVVRGTVDQKILEFHKEGRDLFRGIVEGEADGLASI